MLLKVRDIRQNKSDRIKHLNYIWDCPDCGFYQIQTQRLQPGQSYEVLKPRTKAASSINYNECPNPQCRSKNMAAVVSEEYAELPPLLSEKKQGKYRLILLEGRPFPDGSGCRCPPFKREMEFKAASSGEKNWEPTLPVQICSHCNKQYHLDWTITERNYL